MRFFILDGKDLKLRYFVFFMILAASVCAFITAHSARVTTREVRLYFVDAEMLRLIPVKMSVADSGDPQLMARRLLDELIKGRDENPKIRRLIPDIKHCMTVSVRDGCAVVDIKRKMVENHPEGRDLELLTVYSVVNTLTGIDGVQTVRFTVEGKTQRDFMGYLDMRETFVPDFFV